MKLQKLVLAAAAASVLAFGMAACTPPAAEDEKTVGETIDEGLADIEEGAEAAGEAVEGAAEEAGAAVENAVEDAQEKTDENAK